MLSDGTLTKPIYLPNHAPKDKCAQTLVLLWVTVVFPKLSVAVMRCVCRVSVCISSGSWLSEKGRCTITLIAAAKFGPRVSRVRTAAGLPLPDHVPSSPWRSPWSGIYKSVRNKKSHPNELPLQILRCHLC